MSPDEANAQKEIFKFLQDTKSIYGMCKKYSILIEEILPKHKAPIHAANELKSLVFHLYNAAQFPDSIDINILEAKEHLCRAFYDLHSLIVSIYIEQIKVKLSAYKSGTIANSFPEYGNTIRPAIKDIQESLQILRSNRNTDVDIINSNINEFEQQVSSLARFDDIIESRRPAMNEFEIKQRKKGAINFAWGFLLLVIIALLFMGLGYYLGTTK
jgi:hypothetical protein